MSFNRHPGGYNKAAYASRKKPKAESIPLRTTRPTALDFEIWDLRRVLGTTEAVADKLCLPIARVEIALERFWLTYGRRP